MESGRETLRALSVWLALLAPIEASHAHWEVFDMDPVPCPSPQITSYVVKGTAAPKFYSKAEVLADFHAFSAAACSAYPHGQYLYDAVINLSYKARYFTDKGAAHGRGSYLPCADREYVRVCEKVDLSLTLAGPEANVKPGETVDGFLAKITSAQNKPLHGVAIRLDAALRTQGAPHLGYLVPSLGEGAQCSPASGAEVLTCVTDTDGKIAFSFSALSGMPPSDVLYDITAACTDPNRPCTLAKTPKRTMTIKPCPVTLQLTAGGAQVEPGRTLDGFALLAICDDGSGQQPVADLSVDIAGTVVAGSGGHEHGPDDDQRRLSSFQADMDASCFAGSAPGTMSCTTNVDGRIDFSLVAPKVSGTHEFSATCSDASLNCNVPAAVSVDVKIEGLGPIPASSWFTLNEADGVPIGATPTHPDNHFLTQQSSEVLEDISEGYAYAFGALGSAPRDPEQLHINDASLVWGGLFDIKTALWNPPHYEHRRGTVVDVRANGAAGAIPPYMRLYFEHLAAQHGAHAALHSRNTANQHYHVRLNGQMEQP